MKNILLFMNRRCNMNTLTEDYQPHIQCQAVSKQYIKKHEPTEPTLLIAINDYDHKFETFKERTRYITYSKYTAVHWLFFDDIDETSLAHGGRITTRQAENMIDFLDYQFAHRNFDKILVHCYAGISRSQAVALFIAKYYLHDDALYTQLYYQQGKHPGGNKLVYNRLINAYNKKHGDKNDTFN